MSVLHWVADELHRIWMKNALDGCPPAD